MLKEFKEFAMRGNVLDMAVGIVIGAAFGKIVTSFVNGSQKVYDFVNDNPLVEFHPCDRTNDTALISRNPKVTAINSAIQVDITGQVCADSIGPRIYSGIGGQMDFIRGAALSKGGKPILALPSTAQGGKMSRIVPELLPGAGVVTTRGHVHWIVTEYGAVNLHGMTLRERGEDMAGLVRQILDRAGARSTEVDRRAIDRLRQHPADPDPAALRAAVRGPAGPPVAVVQRRSRGAGALRRRGDPAKYKRWRPGQQGRHAQYPQYQKQPLYGSHRRYVASLCERA